MSAAGVAAPARRRPFPVADAPARATSADAWPNTTRVLPWALAAFLGMLWLVPFNAIVLGVPLPFDRWVLAGLGVLWLSAVLAGGTAAPRLHLGRLHVAALIFAVVAVVSLVVNVELLSLLGELHLAVKKLTGLVAFLTLFVLAASIIRREEAAAFAALSVGLACLTAVAAVVEYRTDFNVFYDVGSKFVPGLAVPPELHQIDYVGRTTTYGPTDTPLELSTQLALALPFAVVAALGAGRRRSRLLHGAATGVILAGVFATERKTGFFAAAAGATVLLAYRPKHLRRAIGLGAVLVATLHVLAPGAMGSLRVQLTPTHLFGTLSNRDRASDYSATAPDVLSRPALGRGYASYEPYKYRILDNEWLGLLIQTGVIGVAAFLALLASALASAHGIVRSRDAEASALALGCACAIVGFAVAAALFDVLAFPHVMYTLCLVLALLAVLRRPPAPAPG